MRAKSGYLGQYTDENGRLQKCIVYFGEQQQQFQKLEKTLIHPCNDDLTPKLNDKFKDQPILKNSDKITAIGFIN